MICTPDSSETAFSSSTSLPIFTGVQSTNVFNPYRSFSTFKYRTEKLNGALQVAIREVYQKTGMYHGVYLKKWDVSKEWKEYKHEFTTRPDATELCLYIVGYYMKEGEKVELKDLKLIAK